MAWDDNGLKAPRWEYSEVASIKPDYAPDTYITNITSVVMAAVTPFAFVVAASDDSLRYFRYTKEGDKFLLDHHATKKDCHKGITCIQSVELGGFPLEKPGDAALLTAGRDGLLKAWDCPHQTVMELSTPNGQPISAIAHMWNVGDYPGHGLVAAGTELLDREPPGDVAIYVWAVPDWSGRGNQSSSGAPILAITESHTDTITNLRFESFEDPKNPEGHQLDHLVSSSTDGLVNVIDWTIKDEEDAVLTVLNNRNAVQHLRVLPGDDSKLNSAHVCAISQDEKMSVHAVAEELREDGTSDPNPVDLREGLACDYVVNLMNRSAGPALALAAGAFKEETTTEPYVDIYTFEKPPRPSEKPELQLHGRLRGAHGEEIVRDVFFHEASPSVLTCGEDGLIRAWERPSKAVPEPGKSQKVPKKRKAGDAQTGARHKPY